ncbi:MAG TPA: hypothetical protein VFF66_03435 [Brevundimonas sp.]|nr:hypothetical protein [Brevundimonas sp.]
MSPPSAQSRLIQALRRAQSRLRGGHVVAMSAVAVIAFGLVGLRAVDLPGPRPLTDDGRLRIEVVHPVEPDIIPGSRMEVGELVNGFKGVPPPEPPLTDVLWTYDESWLQDFPPLPPPPGRRRTVAEVAVVDTSPPDPPRARRAEGRWFGFDTPRRDYRAERVARRARLEAMERRVWREGEGRWRDRNSRDRHLDRRRDEVRWPEVAKPREQQEPDPRMEQERRRAEDVADRESFTGLQ